jgi:hypothetical protein
VLRTQKALSDKKEREKELTNTHFWSHESCTPCRVFDAIVITVKEYRHTEIADLMMMTMRKAKHKERKARKKEMNE